MRIDIWSDVVCPWCYLGARRLELALAELSWSDEVTVHWRAYQLDPRAPLEPQDLEAVLARKYGPGAFERMTHRLTALGAQDGLDYRFDLTKRVNTLDAHRLLAWAGEQGSTAQNVLAWRLFEAYFTRGENVADRDFLRTAASEVGLDAQEAGRAFADERYPAQVRADIEMALERGITGVPAFVIGDAWLIPGAQEVETIISVLERARAKLSTLTVTGEVEGDACAIDDPRC